MSNYDKNNVNSPTIADCNSPGVKEGSLDENSKNTPDTEGLTTATEGHLSTIFPNRAGSWNAQMAIYNGKNPGVFLRGADTTWAKWLALATKSDLDLKLNNTSIFVGNGGDFGQAIKKAGIVQLNRVGFFICNNPSNSPLENGLIILAHNVGYWNNHPMYIQINGSSISCGTLNCSDYTHITKD